MATTELTIRLPKPHARQSEFIRCGAKRIVCRAGRRGGKTVGMAIKAVESFLAGRRVLYAAPTEDQVTTFWFEVKRALAEAIDAGIFVKNETMHVIELPGSKQRIRAKTAFNADTLRGDYADLLILDEFQLMNEDAWAVVGAPMLLDNDGDAVFIYTPPSLRTAGVSKARDKRHAAKFFIAAADDTSGRWATFHFSSRENPHISSVALDDIVRDMTALAIRQEIEAEDIDEIPGAMWSRALLDQYRIRAVPALTRIVVGVDPKANAAVDSNTGIVVAGIDAHGHGYVLGDHSMNGSPESWAQMVKTAYDLYAADRVVVERNQGGDMVTSVLKAASVTLPIKTVVATRGKATRAEPIAAMYEQGRIHHAGTFAALEDELCTWLPGEKSPDRLDALVWALSELMLHPQRAIRQYQG